MTVAFFGALILAWLCYRQKKQLKQHGSEQGVAQEFFGRGLEFFAILAGVLLLYNVLLLFVAVGWQYVSVRFLISLENFLAKLQEGFKNYGLTWTRTLIVLLIIYLLGFTKIGILRSGRPGKAFKRTKIVFRRVQTAVILLASFTLLGSQVGEPAATLDIRLRTVRNEYGILRTELAETLAHQTANQLYGRLRDQLGTNYQSIPPALKRVEDKSASLREYYRSFRQEYDARDEHVERANQRTARRETVNQEIRPSAEQSRHNDAAAAQEVDVPAAASLEEIKGARQGLAKYREKVSPEIVKLIAHPGGKDIILHLPSLFTAKISEFLVDPLTEEYPILKPLIGIFSSTFDEAVKLKVKRQLDDLTGSLIERPDAAEEIVTHAASEIAASVPAEIPLATTGQIAHEIRNLDGEAQRLGDLRSQLEQRARAIENQRIELESDEENLRERAANRLSRIGDRLTREQVGRLSESARSGTKEWITSEEREGHCTNYEYKSLKYYAGSALEKLKSPYVDEATDRVAREAREDGIRRERVTDPGWI